MKLEQALLELGDLGSAIEEARIARELSNNDPSRTNTLAWYLCLAGRYGEALPLAREAVTKSPSWEFQDTLAHAAFGVSNWKEAALAWRRVLAARPKFFSESGRPYCGEDELHEKKARRLAGLDLPDLPRDLFTPP